MTPRSDRQLFGEPQGRRDILLSRVLWGVMMKVRLLGVGAAAMCALAVGTVASAASSPATVRESIRVTAVAAPGGVKALDSQSGAGRMKLPLFLHTSAQRGAVMTTPRVYLVFWGSQWRTDDPAGAAVALQKFFTGLHGAADTWGTVLTQYCSQAAVHTIFCGRQGIAITHPTSSVLAGVWFDDAAPEPASPGTTALADEAAAAAAHFGNMTTRANLNAQYVIASASGTHPDGFPNTGFCAWHDAAATTAGQIAYTNLPYLPDLGAGACTTLANPTLLDGYFSTETHEYAETVTDAWPGRGWLARRGWEIGDLCENLDGRLTLSTGTFDVQGIWSNKARACVTSG